MTHLVQPFEGEDGVLRPSIGPEALLFQYQYQYERELLESSNDTDINT